MGYLSNAFHQPKVTKTIVAIDLANSTGMKESEAEGTWLITYEWFFDLLADSIGKRNGRIVKYMGDGAMAVFDAKGAAEAINWAIDVQEAIEAARDERRIFCDCSIGIAYGSIVEFPTTDGSKDYIGMFVDKAFRLCSAANAKAIFVDTDTVFAAPMPEVQSAFGVNSRPRRTIAEYRGPEESVRAKGFSQPIPYHEVLWGNTRYGVRPGFVTNLSSKEPAATKIAPVAESKPLATAAAAGWTRGFVIRGLDRFGFIRGPEGEDFWFNHDCLFQRSLVPGEGDDVWFLVAEPFPNAHSRRAVEVIPIGATLEGTLDRVRPEGYGFVLASNQRSERKQLFVHLGDPQRWSVGAEIEFTVAGNKKGLAGVEPRPKGRVAA